MTSSVSLYGGTQSVRNYFSRIATRFNREVIPGYVRLNATTSITNFGHRADSNAGPSSGYALEKDRRPRGVIPS